jgi:hypothetical protein
LKITPEFQGKPHGIIVDSLQANSSFKFPTIQEVGKILKLPIDSCYRPYSYLVCTFSFFFNLSSYFHQEKRNKKQSGRPLSSLFFQLALHSGQMNNCLILNDVEGN